MSLLAWIGVLMSVGIGVYLLAALLYPEKFQ